MQVVCRILLILLLWNTSILVTVTGSNHIAFSGFTEGNTYTYYTNGSNLITELICSATYTDNTVSYISTSWYGKTRSKDNPIIADTGSNVLSFQDVATKLNWENSGTYFCRAVFNINGDEQEANSFDIEVVIENNAVITVSFGDTKHVREISNTKPILIPVMTENVAISCDAEGGELSYYRHTGITHTAIVTNPLMIDLFTIEYEAYFYCNSTKSSKTFHSVNIVALGGGIWLQQEDSYTKLSASETIVSTEDITLVCVTSTRTSNIYWEYISNTGRRDRILDTVSDDSKGFLKLILPRYLAANRTGIYNCTNYEKIDEYSSQEKEHSIRISLPTEEVTETITNLPDSTTKTTVATTTAVSIQLYYTPNYSVVFVGVDDVIIMCAVNTDSRSILNVSLVDTETGSILKSHTGSEGEIRLEQRVELKKGDISYKCTVETETGQTKEQTVIIRVEDPYTQEIVNLHIETSDDGRDVLLKWDTVHPLLANETFIIWVQNVNESSGYLETGRTHKTEYSLLDLFDSYHYSIRVQVVSRLNSSNSSLYYVHTERDSSEFNYAIIGLVAGLAFIPLLTVVIVLLIIILLLKRRKYIKSGYSKQTEIPDNKTENETKSSQYYILSGVDTSDKSPTINQLIIPTNTTKNGVYKKLTQLDSPLSPTDPTGEYMSLDQLDTESRKETDSGMEDIGSQNGELQYENVKDTLYQSTNKKYASVPHATLVPLAQYKNHLSHMLSEYRLEKEYRDLGGQKLRSECTSAMLKVNKNKNKYKTIYPYDKSRVVLTSPLDTDYINASFIPGFHQSDLFIAAQAPKPNTVDDFWQLILEQRVSTIVMLTRLVELGMEKCTDYWPESVGTSEKYGNVTVALQKEEHFTGYTVRDLVLYVSENREIKVTQFHYTAWPDHDVPQLYNSLLDFTDTVKQHRKREQAPLLVHCSAGVGRSGTFISLYNLLEAVSAGDPISIYRIVNEMREHRPQMVQTFNQYKFIYLALLEMIFGSTTIPSEDFCDNYRLYQLSQGDMDTDIFREQFQELCYQSDHSFSYLQTAAQEPSNADKNAVKDVLPYDVNRVVLYSPNWTCEYINASYIEGYELVATPLPTGDTIQEFLQLIYQMEDPLLVLLFSKSEYQKITDEGSDRVCYWSEEKGRRDFDGFSVITEKTQKSSFLIQQKMKVHTNYDDDERPFSQFISLVWDEAGGVTDVVGILTLLELTKQRVTTPGKRIIFCCNDGIGKSGVLLTVYRAIRSIERNRSIDVFQTVKQLRNARKNMVPTIEHYLSCYNLINEYCQMNV